MEDVRAAADRLLMEASPVVASESQVTPTESHEYLEEYLVEENLEVLVEARRYRVRAIPWNETPTQLAYQRLRAEVFIDQLGWRLPRGPLGGESDRYDIGGQAITVYGAFGIDGCGREHLLGGVRIFRLRAWDDSMLPHEFAGLGMVPPPIMKQLKARYPQANLNELTPLCVRPGRRWSPPDAPEETFDLGVAGDLCYAATCLEAEMTNRWHALAIVDAVYERVMRRAHFQMEPIHSVKASAADRYGYSVVLIDMPATIKAIRASGAEDRANRIVSMCQEKWLLP